MAGALASLPGMLNAAAADSSLVNSFRKIQVSDQFWSEGASFGDFNKDGVVDVVSGPYW